MGQGVVWFILFRAFGFLVLGFGVCVCWGFFIVVLLGFYFEIGSYYVAWPQTYNPFASAS
jgi:hypothetical protein